MNNRKIYKIIFICSFIPFIILLLIATYHAIFGYDVYTMILPTYRGTIYGIDAFRQSLVWNVIAMCFIPILPLMVLYQLIFIIRYIFIKKHFRRMI